jgi:hypothetical protein
MMIFAPARMLSKLPADQFLGIVMDQFGNLELANLFGPICTGLSTEFVSKFVRPERRLCSCVAGQDERNNRFREPDDGRELRHERIAAADS